MIHSFNFQASRSVKDWRLAANLSGTPGFYYMPPCQCGCTPQSAHRYKLSIGLYLLCYGFTLDTWLIKVPEKEIEDKLAERKRVFDEQQAAARQMFKEQLSFAQKAKVRENIRTQVAAVLSDIVDDEDASPAPADDKAAPTELPDSNR